MARNRIRRKAMAEINMVPFIDIMMVLLVTFMVTTPMLNQGVKVELPKTTSEAIPSSEDNEPLIVSIKADGKYFINLGSKEDEAKDLATLVSAIKKVMAAKPGTQVLIQGDARVDYGAVVQLMAGLQQSGVSQVGLVTDPTGVDGLK